MQLNAVNDVVNSYEKTQKAQLVTLGQGPKPYREILAFLKNEIEMSTKMTDFYYEFLCFKADGVYQLNQAVEQLIGVSKTKGEDQPSGGVGNIQTIDIRLADGQRIKVPYGTIALPDMGKGASIDIAYDYAKTMLVVKGSCEFKFASLIDDIMDEVKRRLNTTSIYKNQAIELDTKYQPEILDLSNIDKEFMVLPETTEYELKGLYARLQQADECRKKGIPLKTGVLFEGPYGTGKTLLAFKIAQIATHNNWAFVYLKDPKLLAKTLRLCKTLDNNGNGVIVFLEDVDQVVTGERDAAMQDILNTLDGGDTKQMNVIALFTTNHIERIDPTFLRGKRIGSIISMGHFDAATVRLFLEHTFADGYSLETEGLDAVCEEFAKAKIVPAFMAEITERVKSNMIYEKDNTVKLTYLQASLKSYLRQMELSRTKEKTMNVPEEFVNKLREVLGAPQLAANVEETLTKAKEIRARV